MVHDALEVVKHRNEFYRDSSRKLVLALMGSLVIIIALVLVIMLQVAKRPSPTYFATTDSGRIIPLVPLNRPNLAAKAIIQWGSEAVISVNSYDFVNYKKNFQNAQKYFTNAGWKGFLKALSVSQNLDAVKSKKLVVSAVLTGAPVITNQYIVNGRYTWNVEMPILVNYQSLDQQSSENLLVRLKIRRISTLDNLYGVGISEYVVEQQR